MQSTAARLLALSAAISQALAVEFTNSNWSVKEGEPFTLTWGEADGPVTLLLKNGPSSNLGTVSTIAAGVTGTSYTWTPTGLPSSTYAVEIDDSTSVNYGSQFVYAGTGAATTTSTTAPSTSTTAPSTSTTATSTSTTDSTTTSGTSSTTDSSSTTLTTATASSTDNSSSTASSTTTSRTSGTSSTSASTATNTPLTTNGSQKMGSSLALVLLTVAGLMFFQ